MSSCTDRLSQIISQAKSKKVTEYKKAIKSLLEFLDDISETALEQITEYSINPPKNDQYEGCSWNDVFIVFHELFMAEIDRISKLSGNTGKLDKERITKLMYSFSTKASYCLKPKDVVSATLQILDYNNTQVYFEYYEMYLHILQKSVLQKRAQRILVSSKQWLALLDACVKILNKSFPSVDYAKLLETLELTVQYGCTLSSLMFDVKILLPIIKKFWEKYDFYKIVNTDILFKLSCTVCFQIATDSRTILCKFSESLPLSVISLKGPEEKYKLFLLFVKIHHPNGVTLDHELSYYDNNNKWKAVLKYLYEMILNDLKSSALSHNFVELACEVLRQRMTLKFPASLKTNSLQDSLSHFIPPKKKRRVSDGEHKVTDLINIRDPEKAWPIIQIATRLYKKYPDSLKFDEYLEFLEVVIKLMSQACKKLILMEDLCKLAVVFIQNEEILKINDLRPQWDKIWDLVLSYLSMSHRDIIQQGFVLIQNLILYDKVSNPNSLLKLYLNKSIQWSNTSIETLKIFFEKNIIFNDIESCDMNSSYLTNNSVKQQLLQWLLISLNKNSTSTLNVEVLSRLLVAFTLKSWYKSIDIPERNSKNYFTSLDNNVYEDIKDISIEDVEQCYMSLKLETNLPSTSYRNEEEPATNEEDTDYPYFMDDLDFLIQGITQSIRIECSDKDLGSFIFKTSLIAKLISDMKTKKMIACNFYEFALTKQLEECLTKIVCEIEHIAWSKNIRNSLEITKALIILFKTKYDILVNQIILNQTSFLSLKKVYEISKINIEDFDPDSQIYQCKINSVIILALYCCINSGNEISEIQFKTSSTLLNFNKYDLSFKTDIIGVITLLDIFVGIPSCMITLEFMDLLMNFVRELFEKWHKDDKISRFLLSLLPKLIHSLIKLGDTNSILIILSICKCCHDRFSKGAFGQLAHLSLINLMNSIVVNNMIDNSEVINQDIFITFVNSPYYLVRFECLKYIYSIFSSKDIDHDWKKIFFDKLEQAVYNIFLIQRELNDEEILEERMLRSISAVQVLATVVCSESIFQSHALYAMLKIVVDKDIEEGLIKKILQVMGSTNTTSKCIVENVLSYLLSSWCSIKNIYKFPYVFLDCKDESEFIKIYKNHIFPVLIRENKISDAQHLADKLSTPFEKLFNSSCTFIIPWALIDESREANELLLSNQVSNIEIGKLSILIKENIEDVIVQMVKRLHDLNHFYQTFETTITLPASDPPHYKAESIDNGFSKLLQLLSNENKFDLNVFEIMMKRKPSSIQKILLQLTCNIHFKPIAEYQAKAFHQYIYFCSKIVPIFSETYCDSVVAYFVKDIAFTLLFFTYQKDEFIAKLASVSLLKFLKSLLSVRPDSVGDILGNCVKILAPKIKTRNENSMALKILELLLIENSSLLSEAIKNLGSLPDIFRSTDCLGQESQSLRENFKQFLHSSDDKSCSIDGIQCLKSQLTTKRNQLDHFYQEIEKTQGFAEDCASSILHQLIYRLIRLTETTDLNIGLEAAKCLGILGPANLTTLILHPQDSQSLELSDEVDLLTLKICQILKELVVSEDIYQRQASSTALYTILNSSWGDRLENIQGAEAEIFKPIEDFLKPFKVSKKKHMPKRVELDIDINEFDRTFNEGNLIWTTKSNKAYKSWLADIASAIAKCLAGLYSQDLIPLFHLNVRFCELTLPRLTSLIINTDPSLSKRVCQCINQFFYFHFCQSDLNECEPYAISQRLQNCKARDAVRCMLTVVNHLRIQFQQKKHLGFDYLSIALAAQFCSAYFSSVLYTELWCKENFQNVRYFDSIPIIDQIYDQDERNGKLAQDILKEAYIKIGESDSLHGCGSSHLQNRKSRIPYYRDFNKLDKLLLSHDIELSSGNSSARGLIDALKESSLHCLAKRVLSTVPTEIDSMKDLCYDSLWRLGDWSQITNLRKNSTSKVSESFAVYHYEALKCLHEKDNSSLNDRLKQAHLCVIKDLSSISLESCEAVYPILCQLQMLREIEEFIAANSEDFVDLLINWEAQKYVFNNNFQYVEPILAQRTVLFQIQNSLKENVIIKNALIDTQLKIAYLAQQDSKLCVAARSLEVLSKQVDLNEDAENRLLYQEAKLAWLRQDEDMARFNLRTLIKKKSVSPILLARSLRVYGNWIAEKKSENPQAIINKYYDKAIKVYSSMMEVDNTQRSDGCRAQAALAQFAHEQYIVVTDYLLSPQFESLKECIVYSRSTASRLMKTTSDREIHKAATLSNKQSNNDIIELQNIQKDQDFYLSLAISNYLDTLQNSDEHDFLIYRLISLWLDNMQDESVNEILNKALHNVPSYKFIPLIPQLAPHMSNIKDTFTNKIFSLLKRCASQHPHHTLPVLLALKNLYNDSKYCGKKILIQEPRVLGAKLLIEELLSSNIRPIIQEMDRLSDSLVKLAYYNLDKRQTTVDKCPIPKIISICDIRDFQHSIVPTINIDVKKNGHYNELVSVKKFDSTYNNVGGINAPKKILCLCSDGVERPQLVKGKDDLRQDAVMQQVFTVMNDLLKSNKESKKRRLYVRTYKVVPLTQRSGVLQWCENTLPLAIILNGDSQQPGLHRKYYPNDYSPSDCRSRFALARESSKKQKFNIFMDCCNNLHPAFHHFFTETFLSPETWFERRLTYTRSVATTSIIGYILGLGDRHVSNILIDKSTAEVIHIDFGIAFEQGKVLPTPETIPFRLTRDIEVAMGASGVEGTMRRCSEETMSVLRAQREIIVTLLKVLLYDPLYSWAITPAKAATFQSENGSVSSDSHSSGNMETNKLAERALLRVQQKLQGIEEGVASSIAGQVERLIQQARDPSNLCQLFCGWQPYL